jgi:hypothetical protein
MYENLKASCDLLPITTLGLNKLLKFINMSVCGYNLSYAGPRLSYLHRQLPFSSVQYRVWDTSHLQIPYIQVMQQPAGWSKWMPPCKLCSKASSEVRVFKAYITKHSNHWLWTSHKQRAIVTQEKAVNIILW